MNFRDAWLNMDRPAREALVEKMNSSYKYLQRLSGGFRVPSLSFANRLKQHIPKLDLKGFEVEAANAGKRMVKPEVKPKKRGRTTH